ncbi:hypothetical protein B0H11DRAFT_1910013 [Mycena galericulata]|nr:hypothetical protein B0H11DRAFT_1910013 [Mycena galericulata]
MTTCGVRAEQCHRPTGGGLRARRLRGSGAGFGSNWVRGVLWEGPSVRSVHAFVDMAKDGFVLKNGTRVRTWPAAMGFSFAGGTTYAPLPLSSTYSFIFDTYFASRQGVRDAGALGVYIYFLRFSFFRSALTPPLHKLREI